MCRSWPGHRGRLADPPALGEVLERVDGEDQAGLALEARRRARPPPRRSSRARAAAGPPARASRSQPTPSPSRSSARARRPPRPPAPRSRTSPRAGGRGGSRARARSRPAPRRRRGSRPAWAARSSAAGRPRAAGGRTRRIEVDVVAEALVAEAHVERDDAPVREALGCLGEVGGRVEHDRRVLGGQIQGATLLGRGQAAARAVDRVHDLVERLVLRQAGDRAGLDQRAALARVRGGRQRDHGRRSGRPPRWRPSPGRRRDRAAGSP